MAEEPIDELEDTQTVEIAESDGEEEPPPASKKSNAAPAAKRAKAAKIVTHSQPKATGSGGSVDSYDEDNDPFLQAVQLSNRKMNRASRTYAPILEDLVQVPMTNWDGIDLPVDISPRDVQFWSKQFCYEVRNLRFRRSKYLTANGIYLNALHIH